VYTERWEEDAINSILVNHYRCSDSIEPFSLRGPLSKDSGYFRFGGDVVCYGRCSSGVGARRATDELHDAQTDIVTGGTTLELPFNPSEIIANLRYERYCGASQVWRALNVTPALRRTYYSVRRLLPASARRRLQRFAFRDWKAIRFPQWPVDATVESLFERLLILWLKGQPVDTIPFIWFWPNGAPSCAIMTHDVEALPGKDFCSHLMDLDDAAEIKASFQIVPEDRYPVTEPFLNGIRDRGFEINVHDLNHDGYLFIDRERFVRRAERINRYRREYGAAGFRAGALYRNLDWYQALDFAYDMSVPASGHLEAQRGGCCSVMPFFVGSILELPVTTTQDYSIFHILNQYSIDLWKRQIAAIAERHGLASFIIHPDYVREPRAQDTYKALLAYLARLRSEQGFWIALPREVNRWWRQRSQMRLTRRGAQWEIEGDGKERACIAYASLEDDRIVYRLDGPVQTSGAGRGPEATPVAADATV
jgi:hypothetical protein